MKSTGAILAIAMLSLSNPTAQDHQSTLETDTRRSNPVEGNVEAIAAGSSMYRQKCADCHGMDARGVRGPDLTQIWADGRTDDGLFRTLRNGIPGTEMPPVGGFGGTSDEEIWKILAYLRSMAAAVPAESIRGDGEHGRSLFRRQCARCHRVDGLGGRLGPDLSRVGVSRARAALAQRIRGVSSPVMPGYESVTLTTSSGQQIQGMKKNEDLFSIQIMDMRERIQGYLREDMRRVTNNTQSAMPVFDVNELSDGDLDDVVAYLTTLRGAPTAPLSVVK